MREGQRWWDCGPGTNRMWMCTCWCKWPPASRSSQLLLYSRLCHLNHHIKKKPKSGGIILCPVTLLPFCSSCAQRCGSEIVLPKLRRESLPVSLCDQGAPVVVTFVSLASLFPPSAVPPLLTEDDNLAVGECCPAGRAVWSPDPVTSCSGQALLAHVVVWETVSPGPPMHLPGPGPERDV